MFPMIRIKQEDNWNYRISSEWSEGRVHSDFEVPESLGAWNEIWRKYKNVKV